MTHKEFANELALEFFHGSATLQEDFKKGLLQAAAQNGFDLNAHILSQTGQRATEDELKAHKKNLVELFGLARNPEARALVDEAYDAMVRDHARKN